MTPTSRAIEDLWFAPGTATDAAAAANKFTNIKGIHYTADHIRSIWKQAQTQGRLPPFRRPDAGFGVFIGALLRRIQGRMAA